jgi:hypothetical protein
MPYYLSFQVLLSVFAWAGVKVYCFQSLHAAITLPSALLLIHVYVNHVFGVDVGIEVVVGAGTVVAHPPDPPRDAA